MKRMSLLILAGVLAGCAPSSSTDGVDGPAATHSFAPFPNADLNTFACTYATSEGVVMGTDAADADQAFTYFGKETLRLTASGSETDELGATYATYRVYDYPDYVLRLSGAVADGEIGIVQMVRPDDDGPQPVGIPATVTKSCTD